MRSLLFSQARRFAPAIAAVAGLFALAPAGPASAALKTLHAFCKAENCGDGQRPVASLLRDASGDLYGVTSDGGKYQSGVVFKLIPDPGTGNYKEYVLHNFCARANCADGASPVADLIMDVDGNLYGTTNLGGGNGGGVVFKLTHGSAGWSFGVIHSFCGGATCAGGSKPSTGLAYLGQSSGAPWDEFSPLFGTADYGGANARGAAYKLVAAGSLWNYEVIHSFNAPDPPGSASPGPLLLDSSGNIFGVTRNGGTHGDGVLYKLASSTWKETTLHNFCAEPNCTDGANGSGRLAMDAAGDLFGTTLYSDCTHTSLCGVVFERTSGGTYSVIHNFDWSGADGKFPTGLIMDAGGNLYGTAVDGGQGDLGMVFRLSHDDSWAETVLYDFCANAGQCKQGKEPRAAVILDTDGSLYGTTSGGGVNSGGTVFKLTP